LLTWDVTVSHTCADSYLSVTSVTPADAAELAASRKQEKYESLLQSYIFQPLAIETFKPINSIGQAFLTELGHIISKISGINPKPPIFFSGCL
jgi:hypothetical protein